MKLSQQLPFTFSNKVIVNSFKIQCRCKGILTAEQIEAEIVPWGPHIIEIKGLTDNCPDCGHVSKVEKRIRDDKTVYDAKRGVWLPAKAGSRGKTGKISPSIVNRENLFVISAFLLSWQFVIIVISHNPVLARVYCFR